MSGKSRLPDAAKRVRYTHGDGLLDVLAGVRNDFAQAAAGVSLDGVSRLELGLDYHSQAAGVTDHDVRATRRRILEYAALLGAYGVAPARMLAAQCACKLRVEDDFAGGAPPSPA